MGMGSEDEGEEEVVHRRGRLCHRDCGDAGWLGGTGFLDLKGLRESVGYLRLQTVGCRL